MRKRAVFACALVAVLAAPLMAPADPPGRPRRLTPAQYQHLVQLERQPDHMAVREMQATYTSNREFDHAFVRASDDFWTSAYPAGLPTTILVLLILAAPL